MLSNIILFYGPNTYLLREKLNEWIKIFVDKYSDINLEIVEYKENIKEIIEKAQTAPFLSEKRMIIVRNFLENSSKDEQIVFLENFAQIPETTIFIISETKEPDKRTSIYKKLSKEVRNEFFENYEGVSLTKWIIDEASKNQSTISSLNANYLSSYCGNDMHKLSSELQKLSLFKSHGEITKEDIELISTPLLEVSIFKLTDLLAVRKKKECIEILEKVIESGEEIPMIFHMIVRQFRLIIMIKEVQNQGLQNPEIASKLKVHPFVVSTISKQTRNFSSEELFKIYAKLLDIEKGFKTGKITVTTDDKRDFVLALERFVMEI